MSPLLAVLDRQPRNLGIDRHQNVSEYALGVVGVAAFKVCVDRQIGGRAKHPQMAQRFIQGQLTVFARHRPSVAPRGRQRLEAEFFEPSRTPDIPGIWDDKHPF